MENQLTFIQSQIWWVITILATFVCANIVCMIVNRRQRKKISEPPFQQMWEMGKTQELETTATSYLRKYPNNTNARLHLALSLVSRKQYQEALPHMEYLLTISPSLGKMIRNMIKEVNERMNDGALTQSEP